MKISLLVQIFVITTLVSSTISKTIVTQCLEHEKTLLLELKKELVFNPFQSTKLVQWNKRDDDCCRWKGVECDDAGHVINLQLDFEGISGGLNDSSSLFNLEYLEKLNLAYNNDYFEDSRTPIPRGIEKLTYLTHLNLSCAGFGGKVPIEFSHVMRRLVSLDISGNWGIEPLSLMVLFHNLTELREVYLDGIDLSTLGIHVIASSTPGLTTLSLSDCYLSGPLDHSLSQLHSLSVLRLDYNNLSTVVPDFFANLSSLTTLSLIECSLSGPLDHSLWQLHSLSVLRLDLNNLSTVVLDFFANFSSLTTLSLVNCSLSGPLDHSLSQLRSLSILRLDHNNLSTAVPDFFANFSSLTTLSLVNCSLSGPLDHSLSQLHSLSILQLDRNNLSTAVLDFLANFSALTTLSLIDCNLKGYFPERIFHIPTLQNLDLSYNKLLSGTIPQFPHTTSFRTIRITLTKFSGSLPDSISNLKHLSELHLSECEFTGPIPSMLSNLSELVSVDLSSNFFTGSISSIHFEGLSRLVNIRVHKNSLTGSIPTSIFALPSLQTLDFSENQFSGQVNEFPIVNISNLYLLDLSRNRLEGPIPNSFFRLQSLQFLRLSDNSFGDSFLLENIVNIRSLSIVDLSGNNLSLDTTGIRSISNNFPDLVKQSTLGELDLSNNKFAGEIPSWIWEIGNGTLIYLNLSCNMFVDLQKPYNIPTPLYLESLDLHSNQFRGELPLLLRHAPNLAYLYLANNSISGSFPTSLCKSKLLILDLSVNNLSGSIPPCIFESNYGQLQVLNLRRNNISGCIPDNFSRDCSLKFLDLSNNNLVGRVPLSLGNCKSLAVMNVGTNHIDDIFPCMLPSSLLILVLHSNRFHGEVRCPGSWPNLQIIDIASNNLSGYLNSSSFSHWRGMMQDSDATSRSSISASTGIVDGYYQDEVMLTIKGLELKLCQDLATIHVN